MIETSEADVIGPTITTDDPHTARHQLIDDRAEACRVGMGLVVDAIEHEAYIVHQRTHLGPGGIAVAGMRRDGVRQRRWDEAAQAADEASGLALMVLDAEA